MTGPYFILLLVATLIGISFLLSTSLHDKRKSKYCEFSLEELSVPGPLILHVDKLEILYPNIKNKIRIYEGDEIRLSCLGTNFTNKEINSDIIVSCSEKKFKFGSSFINIQELKCNYFPKSVSRKIGTCFKNNTKFEIGFELDDGFIPLYYVCFDEKSKNTIYSYYNSKLSQGHQSKVYRPYFTQGPEYGNISVSEKYVRKNQIKSFNDTLESEKLSYKYLPKSNYLSRGHLSPKADFVYSFEQAATFQYLNAAPQWLKFNSGNWEKLESKIRLEILNENSGYTVVTGTHQVLQLRDVKEIEKSMYLHDNQQIPVVKYFWKIIYENVKKEEAMVFIGVNNPHIEKTNKNYILCNETTDNYKWINFNTTDIVAGYLYSCDINQFFNVTGYDLQLFQ